MENQNNQTQETSIKFSTIAKWVGGAVVLGAAGYGIYKYLTNPDLSDIPDEVKEIIEEMSE